MRHADTCCLLIIVPYKSGNSLYASVTAAEPIETEWQTGFSYRAFPPNLSEQPDDLSPYLLRPIYMEYLYVEFVCKCIYVYFTYILDGAGTRQFKSFRCSPRCCNLPTATQSVRMHTPLGDWI